MRWRRWKLLPPLFTFEGFDMLKMYDAPESSYVGSRSDRARQADSEGVILRELIEVLLPCPAGLRRWSIMHTIRSRREKSGREISLKLEDEIERVFRKF